MTKEDIVKSFPEAKQEQIDALLSVHTADVSKLETERDNLKEQLQTATDTLKTFEGVDVKELNGKITQLTADLAQKDKDYQAKLAEMEFNSVLDAAISGSKAKNAKAVRALLDVEALRGSKNRSEDIKAALEKVKSENAYLFGSDEPVLNPVLPTGGKPDGGAVTAETFAKMGYRERLALKKSSPEAYAKLKGE